MIIERITEAIQDSMVLETKAINQEVATQNYNPRFNKPNYQQQNTSFNNYGNRFTQSHEQTFPQQNTYRNNEPNPEQ